MASTGFKPNATLYQLSFEATQLGTGQFVGLICSGEGFDECNELIFEKWFVGFNQVIFRLNFPLMRVLQEPDDQSQETNLMSYRHRTGIVFVFLQKKSSLKIDSTWAPGKAYEDNYMNIISIKKPNLIAIVDCIDKSLQGIYIDMQLNFVRIGYCATSILWVDLLKPVKFNY